jgi:hypothetical protein
MICSSAISLPAIHGPGASPSNHLWLYYTRQCNGASQPNAPTHQRTAINHLSMSQERVLQQRFPVIGPRTRGQITPEDSDPLASLYIPLPRMTDDNSV